MENTWKFYDGIQTHTFTTFPYAFRAMFNQIKRGLEAGRSPALTAKKFKITSPVKREYSLSQANELAIAQGLLNKDGTLNAKEFKNK
jgi:hypothetical protein